MTDSQIIVMDMDDVLVDLSLEMYNRIRKNWKKYSLWFVDKGPLTSQEINQRLLYNINEWLIYAKYGKDKKEYIQTQNLIYNEFCNDIFNQSLYDYLEPTVFAKKTLMNPNYIDNTSLRKVYILTRNINEDQRISKERFVKKYFSHPKIELINVSRLEGKGEVLKKRNINWDLFIDDDLKNIYDVFEVFKENISGKNFLLPDFGFNVCPNQLIYDIESRGGSINRYDPYKK